MKVFSLFIKDGGSFDINIPFPEVNKRFKGLLTDNKKYEIWVKLEHLQQILYNKKPTKYIYGF